MNSWLQTLGQLRQQAAPCVMVTVASIIGSTPREVGARMIVTSDALFGTIGGGNLEYQACSIARNQLANPEPQQLKRFPLGAGLGQCCGGLVNLLFEPIIDVIDWLDQAIEFENKKQAWVREVSLGDDNAAIVVRSRSDNETTRMVDQHCFIDVNASNNIELVLFGAGHVGRAIVRVMSDLPVNITWVDNRDDAFPSSLADNVEIVWTDSLSAEVDLAPVGSYFLVMTHDHGLDQSLTEQILKRDDFSYFGLIGSQAKRRMFEMRLQRRGLDPEKFQRMVCPIGIEGIQSKQPALIAISVAAEIMQQYDQQNQKGNVEKQNAKLPALLGREHDFR